MSLYVNEGATCNTCLYQEDALNKQMAALRQCKKCQQNDGRPGWDPKPTVKVEYWTRELRNGKVQTVRKVVTQ